MKPLVALLIAAALGLPACGGSSSGPGHPREGRTVSGYGLRITLPSGWRGRIYRPSPKSAVELEAATTALPAEGTWMTADRLGVGNSYVIVDDLGAARPSVVNRRNGWRVDPHRPLRIRRSDLRGPYEGGFPSGAALPVAIKRRALEIRIRFGSRPTTAQLKAVNALLGNLSVAAGPAR